jgi:hypothetical protein
MLDTNKRCGKNKWCWESAMKGLIRILYFIGLVCWCQQKIHWHEIKGLLELKLKRKPAPTTQRPPKCIKWL